MVNNFIIFIVMAWVLVEYFRKNFLIALLIIGVSYLCLPVIRINQETAINPAYIITIVEFIIFSHRIIKKRLVDKSLCVYLFFMVLELIVVGIGWGINGRLVVSGIAHFVGSVQFIMAGFLLAALVKTYCVDKTILFRKIIKTAIVLNYCMAFLQIAFPGIGIRLTRQLFVPSGREAPINVETAAGRFVRIFGTFYSPTILGIFSMLSLTFFLGQMIYEAKTRKSNILSFVASLGLGLLAFSKQTINGVFIILSLSLLLIILRRRVVDNISVFAKLLTVTVVTFVIIGSFQWVIGLRGAVNYYYFNANIAVALEGRYGNIASTSNTDNSSAGNSSAGNSNAGNQREAFQIFLEHPVVGVGPLAIDDEFVGDSLYIATLHNGGIIAFLVYGIFFGGLAVHRLLQKNIQELLILLVMGLGGVSAPVFAYGCFAPFLVYCICEFTSRTSSGLNSS